MAILKKGDYVLVGVDGCEGLGKITLADFYADEPRKHYTEAHLVWLMDGSSAFAVLRSRDLLTPIDPAFHNLLTDVYKENDNA